MIKTSLKLVLGLAMLAALTACPSGGGESTDTTTTETHSETTTTTESAAPGGETTTTTTTTTETGKMESTEASASPSAEGH